MPQQLFYNIAGHCISIETPNAEITAGLIPAFRSFRIEPDNNRIKPYQSVELLFRLSGDKNIPIPGVGPADTLVVEGVEFVVYQTETGITVSMQIKDKKYLLQMSQDRKTATTDLSLTQHHEGYFLTYILRTAFGIASAYHKTLKIHASVIKKDGKALVFLGKSGTGKSTHSRLWQEFVPGCTLLNDDEPLVRLTDDGLVWVYGAPWSGSTPCYLNEKAEVAAFVQLKQSPENELRPLKAVEAFKVLFQSASVLRSAPQHRDCIISLIYEILEKVPFYRLDNRPDYEAVSLSKTLLI